MHITTNFSTVYSSNRFSSFFFVLFFTGGQSRQKLRLRLHPSLFTEFRPLPESTYSSRRVEDNLSSVHTVHEPVERVMAPVTDIHSYLPKLCLEHRVSGVALHIICRLSVNKHGDVNFLDRCTGSHSVTVNHTLASLKSPTLGIWFFLLFPSTFPELEITTAVFHRVSCSSSRSRIGETTTMLYFLAS